ncbi:dTDP-4-dehydrorhamnose reductase [Algoriphagus aestuariicola]|uniref:dTDP-4-dehydrorhamnose reductase n=1 Tax=Algoriphagus aestuariicola TaxID=1852016 RepID=A0ABS3BKS2_9BACT|nr:dTDP-4-dehydrorhamnose reductase [Algoriphagus aestuariicola]MBN7799901.1 dTDP-4-dehydrorhamnose reductase [Algoriphagus aestuariicola]
MNKILVTGSNGQLGSEIKYIASNYSFEFVFTGAAELDITDRSAVWSFFQSNQFDAVINCAAYTAVDRAETEVERADSVNHLAPRYLAEAAKEFNLKFVHVSTDYVFDGETFRPYSEDSIPNPKSVYGLTKLKGEEAILQSGLTNSAVIRTSWVYSTFGNNFVKTMLRLGAERPEINVVVDQVGTPTYARDLATCILDILPKLSNSKTEIYHFSNEGVCSWYDFAKAIMEMKDLVCKVNPIPSIQYPTPAKRPFYSVLDKAKIKSDFNVEIAYWRDSLAQCLRQTS